MNKIDYIHKDIKTCEPLITTIELSKENIKFYGNTEEEKNKNEMIYDLTLEVDRLNNIIDELEKYIKDTKKYSNMIYMDMKFIKVEDILDKLKELKENNK